MLVFNVPDRVDFATDSETGEVFGLASTKEIDTVRGIYVRDGNEHGFAMGIEGTRQEPRIRIGYLDVMSGLGELCGPDRAENSKLVGRIIAAVVQIERSRHRFVVGTAVFYSDFEEYKARQAAKGSYQNLPFDLPSNEDLRAMSLT